MKKLTKRRLSALELLSNQLKKGTKPEKIEGKTTLNQIPLSEKDTTRISKQIEVLKERTKGYK
jgi:hypothetical protein